MIIWLVMALMTSITISGKTDEWYETVLVFLLCLILWPVIIGAVVKEIYEATQSQKESK